MRKQIFILTVLAIGLVNSTIIANDAYSQKPIIIFDKAEYSPFDAVKILIADPASNVDRDRNDVVQAIVYTESNVGNLFQLTEVAPDAGVFQALVTLTPDQNKWAADLVVHKNDRIFVQFISESGSSTASVDVDFFTTRIIFDKVQYSIDERVKIFVLDVEENNDPKAIDTVELMLWSTTDIKGLKITLKEIGTDIGVFTGTLALTEDESSSGTMLKVSSSDVITARYVGKILPPSEKQAGSQTEVEEVFGASLVAPKEQVEFGPPTRAEIVDQFGNPVNDVTLGQQIIIQDNVVNKQNKSQKFAYIVLIKDQEGITVSLSWITGEVPPSSTFEAGQSWIPTETGEYNIVIFLWQSIDNPVVLAPQKSLTVTVTNPLE
ncbi:MAG: hypothetical protein ACE5J2_07435 [Nitrososphaerales archaeon]